jgi:hypothetical protein
MSTLFCRRWYFSAGLPWQRRNLRPPFKSSQHLLRLLYVGKGGPEFTVSKRLDCGIAMLHIEVAAMNCGVRGERQFLKALQVARFSASAETAYDEPEA